MLRLCLQLLLAATVVHCSQFRVSPLLSLSNPPAGVECSDGVCSIAPSVSADNIKAEVIDLENKVLEEWKAAGPAEPSSDKSSAIMPSAAVIEASIADTEEPLNAVESSIPASDGESVGMVLPSTSEKTGDEAVVSTEDVEPLDLESKISELKKMGFAATDAKVALKKSAYDVTEAAAMLELEEEEKEIIREKTLEIGEEYSKCVEIGYNLEISYIMVHQAIFPRSCTVLICV